MALTAKQAQFVKEYLIDLNATQAAIRAGYSEKTAYAVGHENLRKPEIAAAIQSKMDGRSQRLEITSDRVLQEIARLGFADIRKVFTPTGQLRNIHELPEEVAASIASVEVVTRPSGGVDEDGNREVEYVHKLKFWDKRGSLELLGKHLKLFTDKVEHEGQIGIRVTTNVVE